MRTALERLSETSGAARRTAADYVTADLRFHHAILVATRNDLLAQLGAIMENALKQRDALVHRGGVNQDPSFLEHHWSVFGAIGEQDEDGAERAMHALLDQASSVLEKVLASKNRLPKKSLGRAKATA
jgi:DNA-binding FadR family transcriptional regulator